MKTLPIKIFLLLAVLITASSCVSRKKLTYLQYSQVETGDLPLRDLKISVTPSNYKLMPYDILFIRVLTPDPQWSAIFNLRSGSQGGSLTSESATLEGYPVDEQGTIEIPFVGKVEVGGKTLSEIKIELDTTFKNYVNDAAITVRLVNNYISIIGEVNQPGRYPLTKDRLNVFEAISMAGDLSEYSNRQKVQLIRPSQYGTVIKEFSLNDRSILTSEFYYILPNDIIYAQPMKGKTFQGNSAVFSMILNSVGTILSLVTTLIVLSNYGVQGN